MRWLIFFVAALSLSVLSSCAPNLRVVGDDYKKIQKFPDARIAIKKLPSQMYFIDNTDDVKDDIDKTGNTEEVFSRFFEEQFAANMRKNSHFKEAQFISWVDSGKTERSEFHISDKASVSFEIPMQGSKYNTPDNFRFVLIFPSVRVHRYEGKAAMFMPGPNGGSFAGGESAALIFNVDYLLWDNVRSKPVTYGKLEIKNSFMFAMTKETWISAIDMLTREIVKESTFEKNQYGR